MLASDDNFALSLQQSGVEIRIPVRQFVLPDEELQEFDALYAERSEDGRPTGWGILVEELREIRRAVEAGVVVEIEGQKLRSWNSFYTWAHGRYHMLEDGYDSWMGDDKSSCGPGLAYGQRHREQGRRHGARRFSLAAGRIAGRR